MNIKVSERVESNTYQTKPLAQNLSYSSIDMMSMLMLNTLAINNKIISDDSDEIINEYIVSQHNKSI